MTIRMLRMPATINQSGCSKSTIYSDIQKKLFPSPVPLGVRAVGWPEHEVQTIIAARIAGKNDDEIKEIVLKLEATRLNFTFDNPHKGHSPFPTERGKINSTGKEE